MANSDTNLSVASSCVHQPSADHYGQAEPRKAEPRSDVEEFLLVLCPVVLKGLHAAVEFKEQSAVRWGRLVKFYSRLDQVFINKSHPGPIHFG
jgi:hypothetical protein